MAKQYKDTFFRFYFSDKTRLLNLCNALTGENATDINEIEINTLEETFFSKMKNDISCKFRGRLLILIEQQSTVNPNMPFRFFLYLSRLVEKIFDKNLTEMLYGTTPIPTPGLDFYVLYNGQRKAPSHAIQSFSDNSLQNTGKFDLKVEFINLNSPHNRELIAKSLPLEDYCVLVERVKKNRTAGMSEKDAFYEAYKFCMKTRMWMREFLEEHQWGVFDMISAEYDEELALKVARQEGIAEGVLENTIVTIKKMLAQNFPVETIASIVDWSVEDILKVAKDSERI